MCYLKIKVRFINLQLLHQLETEILDICQQCPQANTQTQNTEYT